MTEIQRAVPGRFCWPELSTSDPVAAKRFYQALFGWEAQDDTSDWGTYTMLRLRGLEVGALCGQRDEEKGQVPPHWNVYIAVTSADEATEKARALGGTILAPAFDVMDVGRMSVVQDPTGAVFCCWEARKHIGARLWGEPGAACWCELYTTDVEKARAFYAGLFGWTPKPSPEYTELANGGEPIGGMMAISPSWGPVPSHWGTYFQVVDCDAKVQQAVALGCSVRVPPQDIPNVGRFALLVDPQGAGFSVIRLG